jgi:hypothetical protein
MPPDNHNMSLLQIFLSEFWLVFIVSTVVLPLLSLGRAVSRDKVASLVTPRDFSELSPFPKDDQKRLLQNAHRKAFSGWRLLLPGLLCAILSSVSLAASRTLARAGIIPDSIWMSTGTTLLFLALGGWGLKRLEVRRTRRFLMSQIARKPADIDEDMSGNDFQPQYGVFMSKKRLSRKERRN